jgi:hypothetical protein
MGSHRWAHPAGEVVEGHAGFWAGSPDPLHGDAASVPPRMGHAACNSPNGRLHADGALVPRPCGRPRSLPRMLSNGHRHPRLPSESVVANPPACQPARPA